MGGWMPRYLYESDTSIGILERFSSWGVYNTPKVILRVPGKESGTYVEYEMTANVAKRLGNRLSKYGKVADA
jgi:hypothetical protein